MGFSCKRKRPTVATIGRPRQSKNLVVMMDEVMMIVMMIMIVAMMVRPRLSGDGSEGYGRRQGQRGDDSL